MSAEIDQLIKPAQNGDREAFQHLVVLHDERILRLAFQLMKNKQDAEDLYQESFIKAYKSLHTFRLDSSFYTWLYRITVNTAINMKNKHARMRYQDRTENMDPLAVVPAATDTIDTDEINIAIQNATKTLPKKQRIVFVLRYLQKMKIKDVAAIMNISEGTVKQYLFRAMEKMRSALKEYRYV